jgi:pimeloyl-ACP methyl ester carboxylesterase
VGGQEDPLVLTGTLHGAEYEIQVPANWNGTLLVYARGYHYYLPEDASASPEFNPAFESAFLAAGYALAGSAYRTGGWAVSEGIQDTRRLVQFFRQKVGKPEHVILYGVSMGGLIAAKSIEKHPGVYDGAVPICGTMAGTAEHWESNTAVALAYAVAFGWPAEWGTLEDVRDDVLYWEENGHQIILDQLADPENFGRFEFIRLVAGLPAKDFYPGPWMNVLNLMEFLTQGRAELEARAGGNVFHNVGHVYTLTEAEKANLAALNVDADALLEEMNDRTTLEADPKAQSYMRRYAELRGHIKGPVVTIHTAYDTIVPVQQESAYRNKVEAAGQGELLVQVYTDGVGHCWITPPQYLAAFAAMEHWLETGERPDDLVTFFPEGFVHDFEPAPWPYQ